MVLWSLPFKLSKLSIGEIAAKMVSLTLGTKVIWEMSAECVREVRNVP